MAALERVMQMKQQGIAEPQIIDLLKKEGSSPKEINEALSQSKIKTELSPQQINPMGTHQQQEQFSPNPTIPHAPTPSQVTQEIPGTQMQPSMMREIPYQETPRAQLPPEQALSSEQPNYSYPPQSPVSTEMPYYDEYQPQQSADIETINDIAEQIVEEKTSLIKKQITDISRFKEELAMEVKRINQRLSRIENTFDELQITILKKIGSYGEDIQNISKEMHETQDSFSKIINPLTDNIRVLEKITGKSSKSRPSPKTGKSKDVSEFEKYLR